MTVDIPKLVRRRIRAEKRAADGKRDALVSDVRDVTDDEIRIFFQDFEDKLGPRGWTNRSPDTVPLAQHLLLAPPSVIDLQPKKKEEFRKHYGLNFETVVKLADNGAVLPNLYAQNPEQWQSKDNEEEYDYLEPLIRVSSVNGVRVKSYFQAREPKFNKIIERHRRVIVTTLHELYRTKQWEFWDAVIMPARVIEHKDAVDAQIKVQAKRHAIRWAYLDVLAPEKAELVKRHFDEGDIKQAFSTLNWAKHIASPLTASVGGEFYWTENDIRGLFSERTDADRAQVYAQGAPETSLREFLSEHIAGTSAIHMPTQINEEILVELLLRSDLPQLKQEWREIQDKLMLEVMYKNVTSNTVVDWKKIVGEIRDLLLKTDKGTQKATTGFLLIISFFFDPVVAWTRVLPIVAIGKAFGSAAPRVCFPRRHRLIKLLDKHQPPQMHS